MFKELACIACSNVDTMIQKENNYTISKIITIIIEIIMMNWLH